MPFSSLQMIKAILLTPAIHLIQIRTLLTWTALQLRADVPLTWSMYLSPGPESFSPLLAQPALPPCQQTQKTSRSKTGHGKQSYSHMDTQQWSAMCHNYLTSMLCNVSQLPYTSGLQCVTITLHQWFAMCHNYPTPVVCNVSKLPYTSGLQCVTITLHQWFAMCQNYPTPVVCNGSQLPYTSGLQCVKITLHQWFAMCHNYPTPVVCIESQLPYTSGLQWVAITSFCHGSQFPYIKILQRIVVTLNQRFAMCHNYFTSMLYHGSQSHFTGTCRTLKKYKEIQGRKRNKRD